MAIPESFLQELVEKNGYYATVYYHQYPMAAKMREQGVK